MNVSPLFINKSHLISPLLGMLKPVFHRLSFVFLLALLINASVQGQSTSGSITISGKITDRSTGQGVPFASVAVKGKTIGAQADAEGNYQLQLRQPAAT